MEDIHRPDKQGFIPSIHNYCDRRCERCRFVRQCRVGVIDVDDVDEDREAADGRVEDYAERLRKVMGLPPEEEEDGEEGEEWKQDLDTPAYTPDPGYEARRVAVRKAAQEHPFTELSMAYADLISEWMGPREEALRAKGVRMHERAELTIAPEQRTPGGLLLTEAVEEVLWFQHMLYVKGQRAITGKLENDEEEMDLDPLQSDWNGTAKLALHIVDRSVMAWSLIAQRWPEETATIAPLLEHLERCKVLLNAEFPDAQRFIRPGFDAPALP